MKYIHSCVLSFLPLIRNLFSFPLFQGTYQQRPCLPLQLGVHPVNHQLCDNNVNKRIDRQDSMLLREEIVAAYGIFVIYRIAAASLQSYSHDFVFLCVSSMPPPHPTAFPWSFSDFCGVFFHLLPVIHISHFTVHTLKAMKINNSLKLIGLISSCCQGNTPVLLPLRGEQRLRA